MEFKLCPNNDIWMDPDQRCFDAIPPLRVGNPDSTDPDSLKNWSRALPIYDHATGLRLMYVQLPLEIESCEQCILQWTYHCGNNWGKCSDGTEGKKKSNRTVDSFQLFGHISTGEILISYRHGLWTTRNL